jgi:hypothetical protein
MLMIKKKTIAFVFFLLALCYIISPWFFEKKLLFNEILSLAGFCILIYKGFKIGKDTLSIYVVLIICLGMLHLFTSLIRMDTFYYYLRNSVIIYSIFTFFGGYFLFRYLPPFLQSIQQLLSVYIFFFLLVPFSKFLFERFGMSVLFPAILKRKHITYGLPFLIILCFAYALIYSSATIMVLCFFYLLLLIVPGYKVLKQMAVVLFLCFVLFFKSVQPNLSLMDTYYSIYNNGGIMAVVNSHPVLGLDANTTWRLVFWKQAIVDQFPNNMAGLGFGTPLFKYYPVYDVEKLDSLPYVMGAHNSFVYLFARLGILYVVLLLGIYRFILREYFQRKDYYYRNGGILLFWSFFAVSVIAFFNPVLESPVYASAYWLLLGLLAAAISYTNKSLMETAK